MQATSTSALRIPALTPQEVAEVATAELAASLALLRGLDDDDWGRPTDCAGWTVHDLTAHVTGQYQGMASLPRYLLRHRRAHRRYPGLSRLDADNRQQVDELGGRAGPELVALLADIGPKAIRARRKVPGLFRGQRIGRMYPEEKLPDDRLGYVLDVLGLRDPWMHRVDLARATGRPLVLAPHDRQVVAQVIADLGRSWAGPPVALELTGPAGGRWMLGQGTPVASATCDAVCYLRTLAGRHDHPELTVEGPAAARSALIAARVPF